MPTSARVPARVLRQANGQGDYHPYLTITAHRFAGTLIHPVPLSEMLRTCGINRRGCKIVVEWPARATDNAPIKTGDMLEVGEKTYSVRGVKSLPGAYVEVYIDES